MKIRRDDSAGTAPVNRSIGFCVDHADRDGAGGCLNVLERTLSAVQKIGFVCGLLNFFQIIRLDDRK